MYRARAVCTSEGGARGSIYTQYEDSTRAVHIPCTVKTMRQLSCTIDRVRLPLGARMSILYSTYCALAAQRKVPYARRCSYSSIE